MAAFDAGMLELFRDEVGTHVAALERGLVQLERAGAASPERIEPLMRAAHSIKGAARILSMAPAVALAHAMEDVFVAAGEGGIEVAGAVTDLLLKAVDAFAQLTAVPPAEIATWLGGREAQFEGLARALRDALAGAPAEPAPPQQQPSAEPAPPRTVAEGAVAVSPEALERVLGLAGECLVESHRLPEFAAAVAGLRAGQVELLGLAEQVRAELPGAVASVAADALVQGLQDRGQRLARLVDDLVGYSVRVEEVTSALHGQVLAARMRPFGDATRGFPRLVRDLARSLGKEIHLEVEGEATPVDREILSRLEAPLTHLLRNACDHGVEGAAERVAAGKPAAATVRLTAVHRGGMLQVTVDDDGRGIELDGLRARIVARGLARDDLAAAMSEAELLEFLFLPGFSTAAAVTEVSGRGVGLDVVQSMVAAVRGSVRLANRPGRGVTFSLQLPLTLSVVRALLATVAGELLAFPLARIDRLLRVAPPELRTVEGRPWLEVDGEPVALVPAAQVLGLPGPAAPAETFAVVVVSDRLSRYGLVVDGFVGERELVVRALDPRLGKVPDIAAAAIVEDGTPALIVDVDDLVRSVDHLVTSGRPGRLAGEPPAPTEAHDDRLRVLVVEDSPTVRQVERQLLEAAGYAVDAAVDGMDGWNRVRSGRYDLLVTDIDMPRLNGIELVLRVRADADLRTLPVIVVSYKDRAEDRLRGLDAGANYYLTKASFDDDTLLTAVRDLIGEPQ